MFLDKKWEKVLSASVDGKEWLNPIEENLRDLDIPFIKTLCIFHWTERFSMLMAIVPEIYGLSSHSHPLYSNPLLAIPKAPQEPFCVY